MIISPRVRIHRIIQGTWKISLFILVSCAIAYTINEIFFEQYFNFPAVIPTIMGTALAFFIGFNNNQAYDRWWEGRKIWGALVNDSRTWTRNVLYYTHTSPEINNSELHDLREEMIHRHLAFVYALKANLRKQKDDYFKKYLSEKEAESVSSKKNIHNAILLNQTAALKKLYMLGAVDGFQFRELSGSLTRFSDEMGKSERIRNTVFPSTYTYYTRVFNWMFIFSVTIVLSHSIGPWSVLFGWIIGYLYVTTHTIGLAILNPFDSIPSGLPLNQIARTIEINLLEMTGEQKLPQPEETINDEYVM